MKNLIFVFLFFAATWSLSAQELIVLGGAGLQKTDSTVSTNYGFAQARYMIALAGNLRVGPYLGYTQYGSKEFYKTPHPALLGKEFSYGLSVDKYGPLNYSHSYYFWLNGGLKSVQDKFQDNFFKSDTKTTEVFLSGGFFVTDEYNWHGWFSNNRFMAEYQKPIKSTIDATWKGEKISNITAYNKESVRLFAESGVRRFGKATGVNIEPLIHAGFGRDFGRDKNYYEVGGGIGLGLMKDWYRDIFKVKVFWREDLNSSYVNVNSRTPGGSLCTEFVFNASALIKAIKKNK